MFVVRKCVIQAAEEGICDVNFFPEFREGAGPYRKFTKLCNTSRNVGFWWLVTLRPALATGTQHGEASIPSGVFEIRRAA